MRPIPASPTIGMTRAWSGKMAAHVVLPWFTGLLAREAVGFGTYHGLRRKHVDTYLNEFVFRYNRRFYRHASFERYSTGLTP